MAAPFVMRMAASTLNRGTGGGRHKTILTEPTDEELAEALARAWYDLPAHLS